MERVGEEVENEWKPRTLRDDDRERERANTNYMQSQLKSYLLTIVFTLSVCVCIFGVYTSISSLFLMRH